MAAFVSGKLGRKLLANSPSFSGTYFHFRASSSVQLESPLPQIAQYSPSNPRNYHFVTRNRIFDGSVFPSISETRVMDSKYKYSNGLQTARFTNPNWLSVDRTRYLSTSSPVPPPKFQFIKPERSESSNTCPSDNPEFKYQEFEAVLSNETRQELEGLMKTMRHSILALILLSSAQAGFWLWISHVMPLSLSPHVLAVHLQIAIGSGVSHFVAVMLLIRWRRLQGWRGGWRSFAGF